MCEKCERDFPLSRRFLISAGTAFGALGAMPLTGTTARAQAAPHPPNAITPEAALQRIMAGNGRYAANTSTNRDFSAGRAARASAQHPIAAILSCADSRIAPELAFDQGPGDIFVVRVAGNFVNDAGLASLEYGIAVLGIPLIMVLGHSNCGALAATIKVIQDGTVLPGHLPDLVAAIRPGVEAALKQKPKDLLAAATVENVRYNVGKLRTAAPVLSEAVKAGKVQVVGGAYDITTGKVTLT